MRGVAEITLTDAGTGEVERRVEENMVTNAVQDLVRLNPAGLKSSPVPWGLPLVGNAIGGVLLFDREMEEDADEYYAPPDAWPVGYSSNEVDTSGDPLRGSYNASESGPVDGGYRLVFDFGTDRANGTVRSVCLTSRMGGRAYFGSTYRSEFDWLYSAGTSSDNGIAFKAQGGKCLSSTATHLLAAELTGPSAARITRYEKPAARLPVSAPSKVVGPGEGEDFESEGEFGTGGRACLDGRDLYRWEWAAGSGDVRFFRARLGGSPSEWDASYPGVSLGSPDEAVVAGGYLYAWSYDRSGVYRLSASDPSDASLVEVPPEITSRYNVYAPLGGGGPVCAGSTSRYGNKCALIHGDGATLAYGGAFDYASAVSSAAYHAGGGYRSGPYVLRCMYKGYSYSDSYLQLGVVTPYLATIDNLSSPVEKTARHTMKIAYTLYDE